MTDERNDGDEVGTVAEETAKLLSALQDWAKESGSQQASTAAHAAHGLADSVRGLGDHIGHGPDCKFCPVCQVINVVRETSPEVKQHLAVAANSLLQAMQGMLATQVPAPADSGRRTPVEKIDLDDDGPWDEDA
ncbi:MAG TPA: hypothetical protein VFK41_07785 [Nocardioidaceae bacterium]|nr:hypothetical protein [Nocardioidaceae bacterium]